MRVAGPVLALIVALVAGGCGRSPDPPGTAANGAASPVKPLSTPDIAATFAARCASLPVAIPDVAAVPVDPRFDDTRSLAELTRMYERASEHHQTLGLTQTELGYATRLEATGLRDGERGVCMRVKVGVTIAMTPMTVFVAHEVAADGCRHDAVRSHEMRHVDVHAAFLRDAPDRLVARLVAADVGRVRHAATAEALQQDAAAEVAAIVATAQDVDRALLAAMQRDVDTPAEYARVSALCDTVSVPVRADGMRAGSDRR